MTRITQPSKTLIGLAGGLTLVGALAGCATDTTSTGSGDYADGSYSASGSYRTPGGQSAIDVTITLEDNVVTDVEVVSDTDIPDSQQFQSQFISGIAAEVVGKNLDEVSVSRVAGSSLTSQGFSAALQTIKADAAA